MNVVNCSPGQIITGKRDESFYTRVDIEVFHRSPSVGRVKRETTFEFPEFTAAQAAILYDALRACVGRIEEEHD